MTSGKWRAQKLSDTLKYTVEAYSRAIQFHVSTVLRDRNLMQEGLLGSPRAGDQGINLYRITARKSLWLQ